MDEVGHAWEEFGWYWGSKPAPYKFTASFIVTDFCDPRCVTLHVLTMGEQYDVSLYSSRNRQIVSSLCQKNRLLQDVSNNRVGARVDDVQQRSHINLM